MNAEQRIAELSCKVEELRLLADQHRARAEQLGYQLKRIQGREHHDVHEGESQPKQDIDTLLKEKHDLELELEYAQEDNKHFFVLSCALGATAAITTSIAAFLFLKKRK